MVHGGVLAGGGPHPPQCAHWGTFPLGEGSVDAVQLCRVVPPEKAFPGGGKVDAKRTDEGDLPNGIGCVSTEHRLMRNH